tara:strand:- start:4465 stop:5184 length:720 start_codon:yes stop_codon:yes gene_type:complete
MKGRRFTWATKDEQLFDDLIKKLVYPNGKRNLLMTNAAIKNTLDFKELENIFLEKFKNKEFEKNELFTVKKVGEKLYALYVEKVTNCPREYGNMLKRKVEDDSPESIGKKQKNNPVDEDEIIEGADSQLENIKYTKMEADNKHYIEHIEELENDIESLKADKEELKNDNEKCERGIKLRNGTIAFWTTTVDRLKKESTNDKARINELQARNDNDKALLAKYEKVCKGMGITVVLPPQAN